MKNEILKYFKQVFGDSKTIIQESANVNLILLGDHTHYNQGILISYVIDKRWLFAMRKRADDQIKISYYNSFSIYDINLCDEDREVKYQILCGLLRLLKKEDLIPAGFDCVLFNEAPQCIGLGVASAQQIGFMNALNKTFHLSLSDEYILNIVRENEISHFGKISNIAHHYAILYGKPNKLFFIDLRTKEFKNITNPFQNYSLILCDTEEPIKNPTKICNERIEECEVGVKGLRLYVWGIKSLRDVQKDFLLRHIHMLPKKIFSRVLYNVGERTRVELALKAIKKKDICTFGRLISESHKDLYEDYELVCPKCNFIVEIALKDSYIAGAKMISCTSIRSSYVIAERSMELLFSEKIKKAYEKQFGAALKLYNFPLCSSKDKQVLVSETA